MREKNYFSHDYHSRDHLRDIRKDWKLAGVGFYWCLVEILHENGGSIKENEIEEIADDLRADFQMAHDVVYKYGKFQIKKGKIYSSRVIENLQKREEISKKRTAAAKNRWNGRSQGAGELENDEEQDSEKETAAKATTETEEDSESESLSKAEWYKGWITDRINEMPNELNGQDEFSYSYLFEVRHYIENLMQMLPDDKPLTIGSAKIQTGDFWETVSHFFRNSDTLRELSEAIQGVEVKCSRGEVRNKQNYLISTLYNTAKMSGA